jgi:archaellum component FlaC
MASEDNVSVEFLQRKLNELQRSTLHSGGGGGTYDDMEARVKALETRVDRVDGKLDAIIKDVAEIKGKLSNMPATWQVVAINAALVGIVIASGAGLLAIVRMLAPLA